MYRPDRFGRTGDRHDRGDARPNEALARPSSRAAPAACVALIAVALRRRGSSGSGRRRSARSSTISHVVLDRDGQLLRAFATTDGRWRLPATPDDVDPRFLKCCSPTRTSASTQHHGVDPLALLRAALQLVTQRPHRLRRIDLDHAGRAAAGAAAAIAASAPSCAQMARAIAARAAAQQDEDPRALSDPRALWRQYRRHPRRLAGLFRQGADAADARRSGAAGGAAAVAGGAPAGPLSARPRAPPATACSTASPRTGVVPRGRGRARPKREAGAACAARTAGAWRRMPPTRSSPPSPTCARPPADHRRRLCRARLKSWRAIARTRSGRSISVAIVAVDNATGEVRARVGSADYFDATPRRPGRHDAGAALARLDAEAVHLRPRLRGRPHPSGDADRRPADRASAATRRRISTSRSRAR